MQISLPVEQIRHQHSVLALYIHRRAKHLHEAVIVNVKPPVLYPSAGRTPFWKAVLCRHPPINKIERIHEASYVIGRRPVVEE